MEVKAAALATSRPGTSRGMFDLIADPAGTVWAILAVTGVRATSGTCQGQGEYEKAIAQATAHTLAIMYPALATTSAGTAIARVSLPLVEAGWSNRRSSRRAKAWTGRALTTRWAAP